MTYSQYNFMELNVEATGCHLCCRHCSADAPGNGRIYLSTHQILDLLKEAEAIRERGKALFSRWEPFILADPCDHPGLREIMAYLHSIGNSSMTGLATEGYGIATSTDSVDMLISLKECGLKMVQLTFYGLESTHDWFAGRKGSFARLSEAIEACIKAEVKIAACHILHRRNLNELPALVSWTREKCGSMLIRQGAMPTRYSGRGKRIEHMLPTAHDVEQLDDEIRALFPSDQYKSEEDWIMLAERGEMAMPLDMYSSGMLVSFDRNLRVHYGPFFGRRILPKAPHTKLEAIVQDYASRVSPFIEVLKQMDLCELAVRYGDRENRRLYRDWSVCSKWLSASWNAEKAGIETG